MDRKSKIVLVIGIILSVAGVTSLVSALGPSPVECRLVLVSTTSSDRVAMPPDCRPTSLTRLPIVEVPQQVIDVLSNRPGNDPIE